MTVHKLMKKIRTTIRSANLRHFSTLAPATCNVTRWSSTYHRLSRFYEIHEFHSKLDCTDIAFFFIPPRREIGAFDKLCDILRDMDNVTVCLQSDRTTLSEVQALFDRIDFQYPFPATSISPWSSVVLNLIFESGVKTQPNVPSVPDGMENVGLSSLRDPESLDEETE